MLTFEQLEEKINELCSALYRMNPLDLICEHCLTVYEKGNQNPQTRWRRHCYCRDSS